jgi:uncharacterized protein (DUF433 family)
MSVNVVMIVLGIKRYLLKEIIIMIQLTKHRYIVSDEEILSGEPIIEGTRTPVRAIVEIWRQGTAPEEIPSQLPHLTLAQVFDALSYYSDHQREINSHIKRNRIPEHRIDPLVKE